MVTVYDLLTTELTITNEKYTCIICLSCHTEH